MPPFHRFYSRRRNRSQLSYLFASPINLCYRDVFLYGCFRHSIICTPSQNFSKYFEAVYFLRQVSSHRLIGPRPGSRMRAGKATNRSSHLGLLADWLYLQCQFSMLANRLELPGIGNKRGSWPGKRIYLSFLSVTDSVFLGEASTSGMAGNCNFRNGWQLLAMESNQEVVIRPQS